MGRKSGVRNPQSSIRSALQGLKNRWGRFQCPRDGSICKSLEAWHWHRLKYHASQHIDFIDLDGKTENNSCSGGGGGGGGGGGNRRPPSLDSPLLSPAGNTLTAAAVPPPRLLHLLPLSPSDRLLPPEAFAPLRPEVAFPDDASDLTEPEIPVLLSEEVPPNVAPPDDERVNSSHKATGRETHSANKNSKQDRQNPNDGFPLTDQPRQNHAPNNRKQTATVNCDDQNSTDHQTKNVDHFASVNHAVVATGNQGTTTSIQTTSTGQESIFKMIAMQVIEMLDQDIVVTVESVLPRVEENFSQWGLSRVVMRGVVTGTVVGAVDRWKRGYEAGWRDGAKEVLRSPLLTNLALQRQSPDEEPFNDTVEIKN